jgi:RNA recognition motif-containing protein
MRSGPHTIDDSKLHIKTVLIKEKKEEPVSQTNNPPPPPPASIQSSRSEELSADKKLFIGDLRPGINEQNLNEHFSRFGTISEAVIKKHRDGKCNSKSIWN